VAGGVSVVGEMRLAMGWHGIGLLPPKIRFIAVALVTVLVLVGVALSGLVARRR
jgi:hypothetical protein